MDSNGGFEADNFTLEATELRLGLPGTAQEASAPAQSRCNNKRQLVEFIDDECQSSGTSAPAVDGESGGGVTPEPPVKERIVGWPPVRSYRRNACPVKAAEAPGIYVKVSMDGAPYLRKIDLKVYKGYGELLAALGEMFKCFTIGDFLEKDCSGLEYVPTYEDKDGDWMLVGDVPWNMFISSCKRMRVMKGYEARVGSGF